MFNCPNTYAHINEWDELLKCCSFYMVKHVCVETTNNKMWYSVRLWRLNEAQLVLRGPKCAKNVSTATSLNR